MKRQSRRTLCAAGLITAALVSGAFAQQQEEKLGALSFPTSCDPKVQAEFERGDICWDASAQKWTWQILPNYPLSRLNIHK